MFGFCGPFLYQLLLLKPRSSLPQHSNFGRRAPQFPGSGGSILRNSFRPHHELVIDFPKYSELEKFILEVA